MSACGGPGRDGRITMNNDHAALSRDANEEENSR